MLTLAITAIVILGFIVIIHNGIINRYNRVKQAWSDVVATERQKLNILPKLEELLQGHNVYEKSLLTEVTQLRSALVKLSQSDEVDTKLLTEVRDLSGKFSNGIKATFEAYPDLKASSLYSKLMSEIADQEENVGASIRIYNSNVKAHNTGIEVFPNNFVNSKITKKKLVNEFSDSTASASFEYKPNF
ncbi:LemA family protein [Vibrio cholerae]|nr:LemA family protein [Vibrio cholerae]